MRSDEVLDVGQHETIPRNQFPREATERDDRRKNVVPDDFEPKDPLPSSVVNRLNEIEKRKWKEWEYEREAGNGNNFFRVRIAWNFLPEHPFISDPQYDTFIEHLDIRDIQFVKRLVKTVSKSSSATRTTCMRYVIPDAPNSVAREAASRCWNRKREVRQLWEYLMHLKETYEIPEDRKLTAEKIIEKMEMLFGKSEDPAECIRLAELIVKYRGIDLSLTQDSAVKETGEDDYSYLMEFKKKKAKRDPADPSKQEERGPVHVSAGDDSGGAED